MATTRKMRSRIKNIQSTQKITKSMKMVAVSKLRKVQSGMKTMSLFADKNGEILARLFDDGIGTSGPYTDTEREIKKICFVLFVGNRGLCGAYNSNILRYMVDLAAEEQRPFMLVVCGRWGKDAIRSIGLPVEKVFLDINDIPTGEQATKLAEYLKHRYLSGEADEIMLVYQKFADVLNQIPSTEQLLPQKPQDAARGTVENERYIFEPDRATVLDRALQLHINSLLYSALLESKAGEHASRLRAMTAASENTEDLIAELKMRLNRARQAIITTEISEIVGGASAQKKKQQNENRAFE